MRSFSDVNLLACGLLAIALGVAVTGMRSVFSMGGWLVNEFEWIIARLASVV
jgi:hypothetical protein